MIVMIVPEILEKVEAAGAQLVAVTKYLPPEQVANAWKILKKYPCVLGIGENRAARFEKIKMPQGVVQFIGNLQSRQLPEIAAGATSVHSLCHVSHAEILAAQPISPTVWVQVNISDEPQKLGVKTTEVGAFLNAIALLKLEILGLSAIGAGEWTVSQKIAEFRMLQRLRDRWLPEKKISAGTSRDFEIALEEGIEVVRVGTALWQKT